MCIEKGKNVILVCLLLPLKREIKNVWHLQPISSVWRPLGFLPVTLSVLFPFTDEKTEAQRSEGLCPRGTWADIWDIFWLKVWKPPSVFWPLAGLQGHSMGRLAWVPQGPAGWGSGGRAAVVVVQSLSHVRLFRNPMNCSPPGSAVHGIFQARILESIAISFSRGSSPPRDQTHPCNGRHILYHWATREALELPWTLSVNHAWLGHSVGSFPVIMNLSKHGK